MPYSSSASIYGGSSGGAFRVNAATDIVSQNDETNKTVVRFYGYMTKAGTSSAYNTNATYCNIQPTGGIVEGTVNGYDGRYGSGPWYGITFDREYTHNNDGTYSITHYFYHNPNNSPYLTEGWTSHPLNLPTLYRYAQLDGFSWSTVTDVSIAMNLSSNRLSDYIKVSVDNGGSYPYEFSGDWWDKTVTVGSANNPLRSGVAYNIRVQTRRKASGLWATSGTYTMTTKNQNGFFDLGEF